MYRPPQIVTKELLDIETVCKISHMDKTMSDMNKTMGMVTPVGNKSHQRLSPT